MPKDEGLSAGKRSAKTKGPEKLSEAGHESASTKTIQKALERLAAIAADLEDVRQLLGKVESKKKRARPTARNR